MLIKEKIESFILAKASMRLLYLFSHFMKLQTIPTECVDFIIKVFMWLQWFMQSSTAVTELPISYTKTSTIIQDSKRNSKSRYNQAERKQCGQLIRYTHLVPGRTLICLENSLNFKGHENVAQLILRDLKCARKAFPTPLHHQLVLLKKDRMGP